MSLRNFLKSLLNKTFKVRVVDDEKNRFYRWFKKYGTLLQASLVVVTIVLTWKIISLTVSSQKATDNYVNGVNEQLTGLNEQFTKVGENIKILPESVEKFDSTINILKNQVTKLGENIEHFKTTLEEINKVSLAQLLLIRETQRQQAEELAKKPDLTLKVYNVERDSTGRLVIMPEIINKGNKLAKEKTILLFIPKEYHFKSTGWGVYDSTAIIQAWSFYNDRFIGPKDEKTGLFMKQSSSRMIFTIKLPENYQDSIVKFPYIITHSFTQSDTLTIKIPK